MIVVDELELEHAREVHVEPVELVGQSRVGRRRSGHVVRRSIGAGLFLVLGVVERVEAALDALVGLELSQLVEEPEDGGAHVPRLDAHLLDEILDIGLAQQLEKLARRARTPQLDALDAVEELVLGLAEADVEALDEALQVAVLGLAHIVDLVVHVEAHRAQALVHLPRRDRVVVRLEQAHQVAEYAVDLIGRDPAHRVGGRRLGLVLVHHHHHHHHGVVAEAANATATASARSHAHGGRVIAGAGGSVGGRGGCRLRHVAAHRVHAVDELVLDDALQVGVEHDLLAALGRIAVVGRLLLAARRLAAWTASLLLLLLLLLRMVVVVCVRVVQIVLLLLLLLLLLLVVVVVARQRRGGRRHGRGAEGGERAGARLGRRDGGETRAVGLGVVVRVVVEIVVEFGLLARSTAPHAAGVLGRAAAFVRGVREAALAAAVQRRLVA